MSKFIPASLCAYVHAEDVDVESIAPRTLVIVVGATLSNHPPSVAGDCPSAAAHLLSIEHVTAAAGYRVDDPDNRLRSIRRISRSAQSNPGCIGIPLRVSDTWRGARRAETTKRH